MKKIITSVLIILFSICMIVPIVAGAASIDDVYDKIANEGTDMDYQIWNYINNDLMPKVQGNNGASQESVDNLQQSVNNIDLKKDMEDFFNDKNADNKNNEEKHPANSFTDSVIGVIESMWEEIPNYINQKTLLIDNYHLNVRGFKNSAAYNIFITVGYSLVLVFFAANLIENTIKYEIFTLKGGVQILGRLLVSKIIIDLSGTICIEILNICSKITEAVFSEAEKIIEWSIPNIVSVVKSDIWLIGGLMDLIWAIFTIIPVILIALAMIFAAAIIMVKLVLRSLELSLLIIVSPAFFACYSSDVTKPYFKSFIITFIQCAIQIVFMAVVYFVGTQLMVNVTNVDTEFEAWVWFTNTTPMAIIALAIAIMMVKPPKILTGLIK